MFSNRCPRQRSHVFIHCLAILTTWPPSTLQIFLRIFLQIPLRRSPRLRRSGVATCRGVCNCYNMSSFPDNAIAAWLASVGVLAITFDDGIAHDPLEVAVVTPVDRFLLAVNRPFDWFAASIPSSVPDRRRHRENTGSGASSSKTGPSVDSSKLPSPLRASGASTQLCTLRIAFLWSLSLATQVCSQDGNPIFVVDEYLVLAIAARSQLPACFTPLSIQNLGLVHLFLCASTNWTCTPTLARQRVSVISPPLTPEKTKRQDHMAAQTRLLRRAWACDHWVCEFVWCWRSWSAIRGSTRSFWRRWTCSVQLKARAFLGKWCSRRVPRSMPLLISRRFGRSEDTCRTCGAARSLSHKTRNGRSGSSYAPSGLSEPLEHMVCFQVHGASAAAQAARCSEQLAERAGILLPTTSASHSRRRQSMRSLALNVSSARTTSFSGLRGSHPSTMASSCGDNTGVHR